MIQLQIYENAVKCWYKDGIIHRANGPAIESQNGYQDWYWHGKLHRKDGPARLYPDGTVDYWINGKLLSEYELMFSSNQVNTT